jgi:hypothetical protein
MTKVNSLLKYAQDFAALFTDPRILADIGYVDAKVASLNSALRLKGILDGSTGVISAPASGAIGDTYYVTGAPLTGATFMGSLFRNGDAIIVSSAYSISPTVANFIFLEKNDDLASSLIAGIIQIATQAIANAGTDNAQAITALTLAGVLANGLYTKKLTASNPVLNIASGICTWQIPNTIVSADVIVQLIETATNNVVIADINITSANITITFSSSVNIAAGTFKMLAIGI